MKPREYAAMLRGERPSVNTAEVTGIVEAVTEDGPKVVLKGRQLELVFDGPTSHGHLHLEEFTARLRKSPERRRRGKR